LYSFQKGCQDFLERLVRAFSVPEASGLIPAVRFIPEEKSVPIVIGSISRGLLFYPFLSNKSIKINSLQRTIKYEHTFAIRRKNH
jgi:hypothetical protein